MKFFKSKNISRKVMAIFIISSAIILEIVFSLIYYLFQSKIGYMECLYYSSQIIGGIFVISGVVIAVWQYYLSSKSSRTTLEITQVQKAIDLAEYYKDNILALFPAIRDVFNESGINEILKSIKISDIQHFDNDELHEFLSEDQIKKLRDIQKSHKFSEAVLKATITYNLNLNIYGTFYANEEVAEETKRQITAFNDYNIALAFMMDYIQTILNNMEFFAMHFSHNTANESVVYQSLHQSYLEIVSVLYYSISSKNIDNASKFYTNVIWLYKKWADYKKQKQDEQKEISRKAVTGGTIIDTN